MDFYTAYANCRCGVNHMFRGGVSPMPNSPITAGERFADIGSFGQRAGDGPNLWRTLGFRRTAWAPGSSTVEWDATVEYGFHTPAGPVIQGGLVTAILDSAMGGA